MTNITTANAPREDGDQAAKLPPTEAAPLKMPSRKQKHGIAIKVFAMLERLGIKEGSVVQGRDNTDYRITNIGKAGRLTIEPVLGGPKRVVHPLSVMHKGQPLDYNRQE